MSDKKEKIARFGIATKGFVYCLIGALTVMAAIGSGGKKTGKSGVLETLSAQPFGQILLGLTALGLIGFVFWRFYQAIADPEDKGDDLKGIFNRLGYSVSGIFYGILAVTAIKYTFMGNSGSGGEGGNESVVSTLLSKPYGQILVGIVGAAFLGKAIYQLYRAYSGNFKDKVQAAELDSKTENFVLKSGYVGYTARGLVILVISYLTFVAAFTANSNSAGGTKDAFQFVQNEFGTIVLAVIAAGLFTYGFFMFVKSRYRSINI
ncbi:DUF1206 domain-containing protein [Marivirga atlantica]|jgi:hypothetical protein|uniref:DUF1206 domain-containing protein n=1 Tax=Marivirga atlantica TaxID=1548457 RepID=A0A937A8J3_9BACT|nr:DUF1206 domain-containing protein [Marivirga atlantica]MBL0764190.1 DUF1206 domain-containing protein [Marivirga atlantica]